MKERLESSWSSEERLGQDLVWRIVYGQCFNMLLQSLLSIKRAQKSELILLHCQSQSVNKSHRKGPREEPQGLLTSRVHENVAGQNSRGGTEN